MSTSNPSGAKPLSPDAALEALANLQETSARVNLAALGLAAPLLAMRASQAAREAARAAVAPYADEAEVTAREAVKDRLATDVATLASATERAHVTPVEPKDAADAMMTGRVLEDGKPVGGARVIAEAAGRQLDHACADDAGRFALEVPADSDLVFAVARAKGDVVHRDTTTSRYAAGQQPYREFELGQAEAPCDPPGDQPPPKDDTPPAKGLVAVPNVVGATPQRAEPVLAKAGLKLGKAAQQAVEQDRVGLILSQRPEAKSQVENGSAVDVTVGVARKRTDTVGSAATAPVKVSRAATAKKPAR
jgi:hypothetical protein